MYNQSIMYLSFHIQIIMSHLSQIPWNKKTSHGIATMLPFGVRSFEVGRYDLGKWTIIIPIRYILENSSKSLFIWHQNSNSCPLGNKEYFWKLKNVCSMGKKFYHASERAHWPFNSHMLSKIFSIKQIFTSFFPEHSTWKNTPQKTNIEPENHFFQRENHVPNLHFRVPMLVFVLHIGWKTFITSVWYDFFCSLLMTQLCIPMTTRIITTFSKLPSLKLTSAPKISLPKRNGNSQPTIF